jgi:hypothetical protein
VSAPAKPAESRLVGALLRSIVLLAAVVYARTAPRWILGGDNGEFATLYARGGIAHPPGYPSMVLWLRLWHWLPVDTPAHGAALATVVLGASAVWAVQRACLAWGASGSATAFASAVYAFSPVAWKMGSSAEVFALNAMFAGAILALSAPRARPTGWKLTLTLGLLAGLAVADQQSIVFLAPVGLLAAARGVREAHRPRLAAAAGVAGFCLGLIPPYVYMYIVARTADPRTTPLWIEAPTLAGVFFHFRRGAYGTFALAGAPDEHHGLAHLWLFVKGSTRQMLGMPLIILLAVVLAMARGTDRTLPERVRRSRLALGAALLLTGPLFVASFDLPLVRAGPTVAERFYLLPETILTVMGALSIDALIPWLVVRRGLMAALTAQVAIAAAMLSLPEVLEYNRPTVEMYVKNTLRNVSQDALIVGTGDHRWGAFMYARYVLGLRRDVLYLVPGTMTQAWYRRDMAALTGVSFDTPDHTPVGPKTMMARLLATGRPLFYADWPDAKLQDTPHYTVGTLMRVLSAGESPPSSETLFSMNFETFSKYKMESTRPQDPHGWAYLTQEDYARPWGELGARFGKAGDVAKEQICYAVAADWAPWLVKVE